MRNYERLPIEEFGRHLLETGDLDPVYIALKKIEWQNVGQIYRWLIAYWCFYHCGAASYMSDGSGHQFWERMLVAAHNEEPTPIGGRWPRGHERRHFRGAQGVDAVNALRERYTIVPEAMVRDITYMSTDPGQVFDGAMGIPDALPFEQIAKRVQLHRGFGPWISFKVADMVDRLGFRHVDFTNADVFMFKDPVEAAMRLWRVKTGMPDTAQPRDKSAVIREIVDYLRGVFKGHLAPPLYDRPVDLQEIETILCKWKSHMNGHYPLFNDIDEIRGGLEDWVPASQTASLMLGAMPCGSTQ